MPKPKPLALVFFSLVGAGYFGVFSQLGTDAPWRGFVALMPIQLGVLIYFFWTGRLMPSKKP
jgi:hypothetical protein